jgi:hypothetical protein
VARPRVRHPRHATGCVVPARGSKTSAACAECSRGAHAGEAPWPPAHEHDAVHGMVEWLRAWAECSGHVHSRSMKHVHPPSAEWKEHVAHARSPTFEGIAIASTKVAQERNVREERWRTPNGVGFVAPPVTTASTITPTGRMHASTARPYTRVPRSAPTARRAGPYPCPGLEIGRLRRRLTATATST